MSIYIDFLKEEINRAYEEFGDMIGLNFNASMIVAWRKAGLVSADEFIDLRQYSRDYFSELHIEHEGKHRVVRVIIDLPNGGKRSRLFTVEERENGKLYSEELTEWVLNQKDRISNLFTVEDRFGCTHQYSL